MPKYISAIILFSFVLSGCVATSKEMLDLRDDIYQLQLKLNEVQRNQADLSAKMDDVSDSMLSLSAQLEQSENRVSLFSQRIDDIDANLSQRMNKLFEKMSGSPISVTPPPSELYKMAYSDFSKGKYDLAIVGFKSYLDSYPTGELADQCKFYIGESYYSQNKLDKAFDTFNTLKSNYPASKLIPSARLKVALIYAQKGKKTKSREELKKIIRDYPKSPEAFTAKEKLKSK